MTKQDKIFSYILAFVKDKDIISYQYMLANKDMLINVNNTITAYLKFKNKYSYMIANMIQTLNRIANKKAELDLNYNKEIKLLALLEQLKAIRSTTINFIS